jgi:hypothetical protein
VTLPARRIFATVHARMVPQYLRTMQGEVGIAVRRANGA